VAENDNQEVENNEEQTTPEQTENTSDESSASDEAQRLAALEARFERSEEEKSTLRESLRLTNEALQRVSQPQQQTQKKEYSPEVQELGKVINPLVNDSIQESVAPIIGTVSKLYDQTDAVNFQLELQREEPELLKKENYKTLYDTVEGVRQRVARETGSWISRKDAYLYAKGAGMLKPVKGSKKAATEDGEDVKAEASRAKAAKVAQSTGKGSDTQRTGGNPDITRIRAKASRGERLTPEERAKFKEAIAEQPF
jgi:hypothetical protein